MSDRVNQFIVNVFRVAAISAEVAQPETARDAGRSATSLAPAGSPPPAPPTGSADAAVTQSVETILSEERFAVRCQPIVCLDTGAVVGAEALTYGQGYFLSRPTRAQLIPDFYAHVAARASMSSC